MNNITFNVPALIRDVKLEYAGIVPSCVDLRIRNNIHNPEIRQYFSEAGFLPTGELILCNGKIKILPNQPFVNNQQEILSYPFNYQPSCEPTIIQLEDGIEKIVNGNPALKGKFLTLRLFDIKNRLTPQFQQSNLLDCMANNNTVDERDIEIANYFKERNRITGIWNSNIERNGPWMESPPPIEENSKLIHVKNASGTYIYSLQVFYWLTQGYSVLPVAYFQNRHYSTPLKLFIPPSPPYTWTHSENLGRFPQAAIILTFDVMLAISNLPSNEFILLSNPGGSEWVEHILIEPLLGRKVICSVNIESINEVQAILKLTARLVAYGITPSFALDSNYIPIFDSKNMEIVNMHTFIKQAQELGANIPEPIQLNRYGAINFAEINASTPLLENLVEPGSVTVIFQNKNVESNIFSSRIFSAVHSHTDPFSNHCHNLSDRSLKTIVFIDIERRKHYQQIMQKSNVNIFDMDADLFFDSMFLEKNLEDGITLLKHIIHSLSPKVVIFDIESIQAERKHILQLKAAIRSCISQNIAVVIVMHNQKVLQGLLQPDKLIKIWKYGEKPHNHVVEFECINNNHIDSFEFYLEDEQWVSKSFPLARLNNIPDWSPDNMQTGVSSSFMDELDKLPKNDLLGIPKISAPVDNNNFHYQVEGENLSPSLRDS